MGKKENVSEVTLFPRTKSVFSSRVFQTIQRVSGAAGKFSSLKREENCCRRRVHQNCHLSSALEK